jgi:hypothetical protein
MVIFQQNVCSVFEWVNLDKCLITGPVIERPDIKYSNPPNTGLSGIQMVIFRTLFVSGFQMVAAILFLSFEIRTGYFLTSLDRFGMNKIFLCPY